MSKQEREFWDAIEGMTPAEVFARVHTAAQAARQAADIVEIPGGILRALLANVEELEEARHALDWMMQGGRMIVCAGVWGDPAANYMVVSPQGRGPLCTSPMSALRAAMQESAEPLPACLTPKREATVPGCLCGISVKPCPIHGGNA